MEIGRGWGDGIRFRAGSALDTYSTLELSFDQDPILDVENVACRGVSRPSQIAFARIQDLVPKTCSFDNYRCNIFRICQSLATTDGALRRLMEIVKPLVGSI
jgi:hypothetical protein